jgi:aldose sugar dehydrogenase
VITRYPLHACAMFTLLLALGLPSGSVSAQDNTGESRKSGPLAASSVVSSQTGQIRVEVVAREFVHPWGMAFLPDGRILVTERNPGHLRVVNRQGRKSAPVQGVPNAFRFKGETGRSQAGLFDVAVHPRFAENRMVYLSLSKPTERGTGTSVVRGRLVESDETFRLEQVEPVFDMKDEDQDSSGLHFGGRMAIQPLDDTLFLSIGDRRNISRAQDLDDQAGSIIRIGLDGQVPQDNPFVGSKDRDAKIYSGGSRNSQALALHPQSGRLWSIEHGPKGGDRVDVITRGGNHGWPFLSAGPDYSGAPLGIGVRHSNMVGPVHVFKDTVAPSGAAFYQGDAFPAWRGNLLVGGLVSQGLVRLTVDEQSVKSEERISIGRRIRDVKVGPDGAVWLLTEHEDGELLRLTQMQGQR